MRIFEKKSHSESFQFSDAVSALKDAKGILNSFHGQKGQQDRSSGEKGRQITPLNLLV